MALVLLRRSTFTNYGIAVDSVGANHGSLVGFADPEAARSTDIPSVLTGRSLLFANNHVKLSTLIPNALANATYAGWMNCNNAGWFRAMFYYEAGAGTPYIPFFFDSSTVFVGSGDTLDQVSWTITPLSLNTWYHIAVTVTATTTIRLYINGVSQGDRTLALGMTAVDMLGPSWRGYLDDMRYYGASLPDAQMVQLAAGNEAIGYTPVHHWKFDEGL